MHLCPNVFSNELLILQLRQEAKANMDTILQLKTAYETDPYGALQPISEKIALRRQQEQQENMFAAVSLIHQKFTRNESSV